MSEETPNLKPNREPSAKQLAYWETLKGIKPGKVSKISSDASDQLTDYTKPFVVNGYTVNPPDENCDRFIICHPDGTEVNRSCYQGNLAEHVANQLSTPE